MVGEIKNRTNYGPERISEYALDYHQVIIYPGTIRSTRRRKERRQFVNGYAAKPFEVVQVDLKHIRDQKALSQEQIIHLDKFVIPNYQWGALDVNSRFKIIAYSREKSWTNGLCFFLWVTSWLRGHGVECEIVYTVANGEEVGGKSWLKVTELRKLLSGFGCRLIQNHKGHPDDEEFYALRATAIRSEEDLKEVLPIIDDNIRHVRPIILDNVSVKLGPWSGYHVLAQNLFTSETASPATLWPGKPGKGRLRG